MGGAFICSALLWTLSILSCFSKIVRLPLCICGEEVNCHRTCLMLIYYDTRHSVFLFCGDKLRDSFLRHVVLALEHSDDVRIGTLK